MCIWMLLALRQDLCGNRCTSSQPIGMARFKVQGQEILCETYDNSVAYINGVSEAMFKVGMCLPAGPYVSDEDVKYIVDTIKSAIV